MGDGVRKGVQLLVVGLELDRALLQLDRAFLQFLEEPGAGYGSAGQRS